MPVISCTLFVLEADANQFVADDDPDARAARSRAHVCQRRSRRSLEPNHAVRRRQFLIGPLGKIKRTGATITPSPSSQIKLQLVSTLPFIIIGQTKP